MESFRCYDNSDVIATLMVAVFPNVCLWRRILCSDLVLTIKNCVEPPSYARTAYVVAIWPSFLFDSFVKIWATCEMFLGKWFTAPPGKKFPVRLWTEKLAFHKKPTLHVQTRMRYSRAIRIVMVYCEVPRENHDFRYFNKSVCCLLGSQTMYRLYKGLDLWFRRCMGRLQRQLVNGM